MRSPDQQDGSARAFRGPRGSAVPKFLRVTTGKIDAVLPRRVLTPIPGSGWLNHLADQVRSSGAQFSATKTLRAIGTFKI